MSHINTNRTITTIVNLNSDSLIKENIDTCTFLVNDLENKNNVTKSYELYQKYFT